MDKIVIEGGRRLEGEVTVSGAKNSALPLIFSALLTDKPVRLRGVPDVADIRFATALLEGLGAKIARPAPGELVLDCSKVTSDVADYELVRKMRASFLVLGPLLARFGHARVSQPGGCAIGARPVLVRPRLDRAPPDRVACERLSNPSVRAVRAHPRLEYPPPV